MREFANLAIGPIRFSRPPPSVYLANALVPGSEHVAVTAQRRDSDQTELTIDYVVRAAPATTTATWLGSIVAAMGLSMFLIRRPRFAAATPTATSPQPPL